MGVTFYHKHTTNCTMNIFSSKPYGRPKMPSYSCWDRIQGAYFQDGIGISVSVLGQGIQHVGGNLPDIFLT